MNRSSYFLTMVVSTLMLCCTPLASSVTTKRRSSLLCAVFIDISRDKIMSVLRHNIRHALGNCSTWALLPYTPTSATLYKNIASHSKSLSDIATNSNTNIIYILHDNSTYYEQQGTMTKLDLIKLLLPYLPQYRRVWILDEDISILQINFNEFFGFLDCQSGPLKNTLISQALVEGPTSYFFLRKESWADRLDYAVAPSLFIEEQSTILNSNFLAWYINNVVEVVSRALGHNADCDWGMDLTWCGAAKHYLNHHINSQLNSEPEDDKYSATNNDGDTYVCTVIMGSSYFTHLDLQSGTKHRIHGCKDKSKETVKLFRDLFPLYYFEMGEQIDHNTLLNNVSLRLSPLQLSKCSSRG